MGQPVSTGSAYGLRPTLARPVTWPAPLKSRYVTWGALQVLYAFAFAFNVQGASYYFVVILIVLLTFLLLRLLYCNTSSSGSEFWQPSISNETSVNACLELIASFVIDNASRLLSECAIFYFVLLCQCVFEFWVNLHSLVCGCLYCAAFVQRMTIRIVTSLCVLVTGSWLDRWERTQYPSAVVLAAYSFVGRRAQVAGTGNAPTCHCWSSEESLSQSCALCSPRQGSHCFFGGRSHILQ